VHPGPVHHVLVQDTDVARPEDVSPAGPGRVQQRDRLRRGYRARVPRLADDPHEAVLGDRAGCPAVVEWRISPAFDLPSSLPYGDTTMATSLGGRRREDITRAVFCPSAPRWGCPSAVAKAVDQQCAAVEAWLPGLDGRPTGRILAKHVR
jgi:hypothetical protein